MRKRLIELRKKQGLSRKTIAEMLQITESFYGKIERGDRNPVLETAKKIADIVGAKSVDEIFFTKKGDETSHKKAV